MTTVAYRKKQLVWDRLFWSFFVCFLAALAFFMLARDARKQYGAVSFGVFPEFRAVDNRGQMYDQHQLKGQLSVVILTDEEIPDDISIYLQKLSQATAFGQKYLRGLILTLHSAGPSDRWLRYLTLTPQEYQSLTNWSGNRFKDRVILIDQNGAIRGIFDLQDKLQRLNFEGAVRAIL